MRGEITSIGTIKGALAARASLAGSLSSPVALSGGLSIPTYVDVDLYDGDYIVAPDFDGKTLPTTNKTLIQDVTVKPIEVQVVSNTAGGKTVYIGGII